MEFRDRCLQRRLRSAAQLDAPKKRELVLEPDLRRRVTGRLSDATLSVRSKGDGS